MLLIQGLGLICLDASKDGGIRNMAISRRGWEGGHARDVGYVALHALMLSEGVQYGQ